MSSKEFRQGYTPEGYAIDLRHQLGLGFSPIDLEEVCAKLEIDLTEEDLGKSGKVAGCLVVENGYAEILINKNIIYFGRKQFTIAHEIGHWAIPSHRNNSHECWSIDIYSYHSEKRLEVEANRFASEFLLPTAKAQEILKRKEVNFSLIKQVAEEFGMSVTATAIKFVKLTKYDTCATVLFENGKPIWTIGSESFNKHWQIKRKIDLDHLKEIQQCRTDEWLISEKAYETPCITVESMEISNLDQVLSIISVPINEENIDDEY